MWKRKKTKKKNQPRHAAFYGGILTSVMTPVSKSHR
jgi:hypothetical protein